MAQMPSAPPPTAGGGSRRGAGGGGGRGADALALGSFVALGLPDGMLGTAWPALRRSLEVPVGDLGLVLLAVTAGAVAVTAVVGSLIRRSSVPTLLAAGGACAAVASAGFAVAPALGVLLGVAVLFGVSAGLWDGGLNTAIGLSGRRRLLNLLHGAYGVGTAVGPLVVTAAVVAGSWRDAYLVLVGVDGVVAGLWVRQRRRPPPPRPSRPQRAGGERRSVRRPRASVLTGVAVFFVYTGLEVSAGQWETTFARGQLHLGASAAGLATFGYWAALTAVRVLLAWVPTKGQRVVHGGVAVAVAATVAIWLGPGTGVVVAGFVVLGGALAGVFPALIAETAPRLGEERARHVIAWQVGAASAGGAGLSALVGLAISVEGLAVLGPSLVVLAAVLVASVALLERLSPVGAVPPPAGSAPRNAGSVER